MSWFNKKRCKRIKHLENTIEELNSELRSENHLKSFEEIEIIKQGHKKELEKYIKQIENLNTSMYKLGNQNYNLNKTLGLCRMFCLFGSLTFAIFAIYIVLQ